MAPEVFEYQRQEVVSNVAITVKNEKLCQTKGIPGTQGIFSDTVTSDISGFTNEPVVQCDVQVAGNTFADNSK